MHHTEIGNGSEQDGAERVLKRLQQLLERSAPGARLPSVRALMRTHDTTQLAVMRALDVLERQGRVERRARSGLYAPQHRTSRSCLVLVGPSIVINPSPFGELLVNHVVQAFNAPDADCVLRFSHVSVVPDRPLEVRQYLPEEIWHGIRAKAYSLIVALGVAPIAMRRIEELHGPVVSFGTSSAFSVRLAMLEACQLGVAELTKRARRIALYHTPYISMREVFVAALRAHGVEEAFRPHPLPLSVNSAEFLVRPQNLVELGWHTARSVFSAAESEWPDAVLSLDDMFTQGYILGLEDIGIDWRRRCQIATYANEDSPVLTPWDRHLILMSFSTRELAERMRRGAEEIQRSGAPEKGWENFDHSDPKFNERYELIRCRLTVPEKL